MAPRRQQVNVISRRTFGRVMTGFLFAASSTAIAQSAPVVRRIGKLELGTPDTSEEIRQSGKALRELGWVEGWNLHVERRYASGRAEALQPLAEEMVRAQVEVIVTYGTAATLAAMQATTTIPIVFGAAGDPVASGLVRSLARPGGNVTGLSLAGPEVEAKHLTLLKELLPMLRRVGVFEPSGRAYFRETRGQFEHSCRLLNLEPIFVEVATASEIEASIARLVRQGAQAAVLRADSFILDNRFEITSAALKYRLPTMAEQSELVRDASALVAYSVVLSDAERRSASYVDRILRGAKPADLPVEQPTRFELLFNLQTARLLGVTIPQTLLLRADEVIR